MYVVTKVEPEPDLSHVDLWYERDAGERVGIYNLYRVRLREECALKPEVDTALNPRSEN
jgi:hypothetical protein